jgi:colanic acid biosynthesis glycosyl transferase WcaI
MRKIAPAYRCKRYEGNGVKSQKCRDFAKSGQMRKILIYGINYAPEMIGVGRFTGEIGAHLATHGFDVCVVTAPPHYPGWRAAPPYSALRYARETRAGVKILRCPLLLRADMRGIWRLLAPFSFALTSAPVALWKIVTHRPDIVLCVEPTFFVAPAGLLAKFPARFSMCKISK